MRKHAYYGNALLEQPDTMACQERPLFQQGLLGEALVAATHAESMAQNGPPFGTRNRAKHGAIRMVGNSTGGIIAMPERTRTR